jgi:hypothetical protein
MWLRPVDFGNVYRSAEALRRTKSNRRKLATGHWELATAL